MTVADIPLILDIERRSLPTPWKVSGYQHELAANELAHYWVLEEGPLLVGFAGYWLVGSEAQISMIAVDPGRQGQGLGALLLLHLLADAFNRGAREATLEVRRENTAAQRLYTRYGFQEVGLRRGYYKDTGEDAVLMTLWMPADQFQARWRLEYTHLMTRLSTAES